MKHFQYLVLALTLLSGSAPVVAEIIKKTSSGICHPPQSTYYDRTQNFSAFHSVEACISSGGHLPKLSMAIYFDPPLANKIDPPFIV